MSSEPLRVADAHDDRAVLAEGCDDPGTRADGGPSAPPPEAGLSETVIVGITWSTAIFALQIGAQLCFTATLARLLSPHDYGIMAAAMIVIQFASNFTDLGLNATIIQAPTLDVRMQRVAYGIIVAMSATCCLAMMVAAPGVAAWFRTPDLEAVVRVLSLVFLAQAIGALAQGLSFRELRAREVYVAQLAALMLSNVFVTIPLAVLGWGYWSLVLGSLAQATSGSLILRWRRPTPLIPIFAFAEARQLMRSASRFSLAELVAFVSLQADNIIVGRFINASALGLYSRAFNLMSLPSTIYASVAERVVFPAMSRVQSESARLRVAYARGLAMTAFVGLPLTAVLVIAAPQLIQVIFGPQWSGAIAPFMGLASSMYCRISWRVSSSLLRSRGRVDLVILTNASQATLVVGGCMLAYPYGLEAVAAAVSLSFLVGYVVVTTLACRNIGLTFAEYCATQVNGIALGCLVATLAFAGAALAGAWHLSNLTALLVIFATAGAGALVAIVVGPRVFVGPDVSPMAQIVRGLVRRNVKPRRRDLI